MARDYELGLIINPDVGDDQARAIVDRLTQTVAASDGQVVRVNAWGRRRLAYPIEHHRDGLYFFFDLILAPTAVTELDRSLRVNEAVLRHIVKVRDPRIVEQQRQREAEAEAQAAAQAAAQATPATEAPAESPIPAETAGPVASPVTASAETEQPAVETETESADEGEGEADTESTEAEARA